MNSKVSSEAVVRDIHRKTMTGYNQLFIDFVLVHFSP